MAVRIYLKGQSSPVDVEEGIEVSWHHAQISGGGSFSSQLLQVKNKDGHVIAEFMMAELAGYEVRAPKTTS